MNAYTYIYNDYKYWQELDFEDDNVKIWHEVLTPTGERITMDWSPYCTPSFASFQKWVDLGCPQRIGCGPLDETDLAYISGKRFQP